MNKRDMLKLWADPTPVLDHGFVALVDVMGDDGAIVEAARQSTSGSRSEHKWSPKDANGLRTCSVCKGISPHNDSMINSPCLEGDRRFLRYMFRSGHTSPFEMCEIKLLCKMPIFVARQWIRHRTANVNEMSGRYTVLPDEFYIPKAERIGGQGKANKQGTEGAAGMTAEAFQGSVEHCYAGLRAHYERATANEVANELARLHTGVGQYTQWMWKIDLHNLLHFLGLRCDEHAQWEIRQYADVICKIVRDWCPMAWEAWDDYSPKRGAHTFSRQELAILRGLIALDVSDNDIRKALGDPGEKITIREEREFLKALGVIS